MPSLQGKCLACHRDVDEIADHRGYFDKLVAALRHPEAQTAKRAAWILGEIKDSRAVSPLLEALSSSSDIYFAEAVVDALGKMGDKSILETLEFHMMHGALPVRRASLRAVANIMLRNKAS